MHCYEQYCFPWILKYVDRAVIDDRKQTLAKVQGRVLEIGIGTGSSVPWYPENLTEVVGIEPCGALLDDCAKAVERVQQRTGGGTRFTLSVADAQALPFPDNSFDTVVAFLVFCTIPDPYKAAQEAFRVLKSGGRMVFFEHVRSDRPTLAKWQRRSNPVWKVLGCGCHLDRDTRAVLAEAGFRFEEFRFEHKISVMPLVSPIIQGVAVKP
ncbi:MAG: class I SAM-dependent methyltransferase [Hahellaceae bacterium]|nr:class I SAM-dependent methyltransferase [Hahellaceae bacterium]MCP5168364.1 class I SAM-dependent methyltransferase [Hahellaceae bacterium]